jgi:hypothetical protein
MGMCCCTLLGSPIGLTVGSSTACCKIHILQRDPPLVVFRGVDATLICFFAFLLLASFVGLYIPLTVLCARADGVPWKFYPTEGECWSEGGAGTWMGLGLAAGFLMGFATVGLAIAVCRSAPPRGSRSSSTTHDDGDVEAVPITGSKLHQ